MADNANADSPRQLEVRANYDAFMKQLPQLLATHVGKFALMRHGQIVDFFDTPGDANRAGIKLYSDALFSIQEVTDSPVDLGFFSHAMPHRSV